MSSPATIPFSVLDVVPLHSGSTARAALAESIALARHVESLGYVRYWFAEHHGMEGIASAAPAVLVGQVAAATTTLRVGSGGVMLPNHSPLAIAEQFGTLEALYPGRIDLGIGRAPGSEPLTAAILRRTHDNPAGDELPVLLEELFGFFRGDFPAGHPFARVRATPAYGNEPPVWLLGSSDYSARLAGRMGLPFAFAHHFSQGNTLPALAEYRANFRASKALAKPYAIVAANVTVGETDEHARRLALPHALAFLRLRLGRPARYPTIEEAERHPWTPPERAFAEEWFATNIVGGPESVRRQLDRLLALTEADELMVLSAVPDAQARRDSYSRLRALYPLPLPPSAASIDSTASA